MFASGAASYSATHHHRALQLTHNPYILHSFNATQAFEANNQNGISALRSDCRGLVTGLTFELRPWAGGWTSRPNVAPLATGRFKRLSAIFTAAGVPDGA